MAGGGALPEGPSASVFKVGLFRREYREPHPRLPPRSTANPSPRIHPRHVPTSLFFLWGFAYGLLDTLNKHFQNVLGITKIQSTGLQVAYFGFGYFAFSPVAGETLHRRGYKFTIIMGLILYSLGAIFFWPVAKFSVNTTNKEGIFGGFVACTGVIACGLATLEVSANSYISVMPPVSVASMRLQFSQSFNGVASFAGPLIASKYFFSGSNSTNLTNVQWVYLAVAGMGVAIALCFVFTKLPEVSEEALSAQAEAAAVALGHDAHRKPLWKEYRAISGFVAQFLYVGAQVTIGSFFLNYTKESADIEDARGSQLLSYALILFTVGRFVGTALLSVFTAPVLLFLFSAIAAVCSILISTLPGMPGVVFLMVIMFFESIMYPCIFTLATRNLGHNTRRAAALLVMGVSGGAVFPPCQAAIAEKWTTRVSYFIVLPCFIYIGLWAVYIWAVDGRQTFNIKSKGIDAEVPIDGTGEAEHEKHDDVQYEEQGSVEAKYASEPLPARKA